MKYYIFGLGKRERKLLNTFRAKVSYFEELANTNNPSCVDDLTDAFYGVLRNHKGESETWSDLDYDKTAHIWIVNLAFDLLACGKYHIYTGILSKQGEMMRRIYEIGMRLALENKDISQEEYEEQLNLLRAEIKRAG